MPPRCEVVNYPARLQGLTTNARIHDYTIPDNNILQYLYKTLVLNRGPGIYSKTNSPDGDFFLGKHPI
jgi:hypothetical protein